MAEQPQNQEFVFEFYIDDNVDLRDTTYDALYDEALEGVRKLRGNHTDIVGVTVVVRHVVGETNTPHAFSVTFSGDVSPNHIAAVKDGERAGVAMREALRAFERQVREQRDKLRGY